MRIPEFSRNIYGMKKALQLAISLWFYSMVGIAQPHPTPLYTREDLLGQFDPASHPDFIRIPEPLTQKQNIYLRKETLGAFQSMWLAAEKEGVRLEIISATRNFSAQKSIWNRKWNSPRFMGFQGVNRAREILRYSSMPGTSRHHWGTDIDLNALDNAWFETSAGSQVYAWLSSNAPKFGFHQVYTDKTQGRTGYEEERWHWSYLPLAEPMWLQICAQFTNRNISGFQGEQWADSLQIMKQYVQGIALPQSRATEQ